ncbi:MAG TPA: biopolymer transporter ExbD [Rudaea sp.]|nr:biopolymer transporter ExbD [Rudaea sp.]
MAFSSGGSEGGVMAEINVTPLVDVMLVLLIIFMITAPLASHKIKVELPIASLDNPPDEGQSHPITLAVRDTGALYWDDEPVTEASMQAKLRVAAQRQPQPELQIRADKDTEYQLISTILGDIKDSHIVKVGFVAQAHAAAKD